MIIALEFGKKAVLTLFLRLITFRLLLFIKFNTKINQKPITYLRKCVHLHQETYKPTFKINEIMTKEDEADVQRLLKNVDVTELMDMLMKHGNRYSRRILKFFRWFCKYVPVVLMCFHAYGIWEFSQHQREMFIPYAENTPCYLYIYFMVYILPMVAILASRFFFLCWRYRIPFFYFFGINAAHIVEWSWYTTNDMVDSCYTVMVVTAMFYIYGFADMFISRTKLGRKICA